MNDTLVSTCACLCKKLGGSLVRNREIEEVVFIFLCFQSDSVCQKFYFRKIGIDGYVCSVLHTVNVSFATDMYKWLIR